MDPKDADGMGNNLGAVWSGSTLFAQSCQSENLGPIIQELDIELVTMWAASWQNQYNECAPSEDSDQPGHLPSLIRVFAMCSKGS